MIITLSELLLQETQKLHCVATMSNDHNGGMVWYGIFSHKRVIIIKLSITCFTISYEDENQYTYSQFHNIECIHHNTQII